jgi:putative copper resistance protein D
VLSPVALLGVVAAAAVYGRGVSRVRRPWPATRTVAFAAGLVVLLVATQGPVAANDDRFGVHAVQHLLLAMSAPPLLALGAPVTLALQSWSPRNRQRLRRALRHGAIRVTTHPLVALAVFAATPFVLYFTDLYDATLDHAVLHEAVHAVMLVGGVLFFWPVVSLDPIPHRLAHLARVGLVFLAIPFHAFLGIALLTGGDESRRAGGGIIWASGDLLAVVILAVVAAQWMAADEREAAREDRRLGGAGLPA